MPLGASRITLLAFQASAVTATATIIRAKVGLEAKEQVQIDTASYKFGGSSALFDGGTNDYIVVDHTAQKLNYGDDFTFECWVKLNSLPSVFAMLAMGSSRGDYLSIYNKSGTWTIAMAVSDGSTVYTQIRNIGSSPGTGSYNHIAVVKDGSNLKFYWNGTELTTNNGSAGSMSASLGWDGVQRLGDWAGGSNYALNGHLDEVRISKNVRYNTNFSTETSEFTNDDDTLLLCHFTGTDGSNYFQDDNGNYRPQAQVYTSTISGATDTKISEVQQKLQNTSLDFHGSGGMVRVSKESVPYFGTNQWTLEFYVRFDSTGTQVVAADMATSQAWLLMVHGGSLKMWYSDNGSGWNVASGYVLTSISTATWYHIAVVKNSSTDSNRVRAFVNGTENTGFYFSDNNGPYNTGSDISFGGVDGSSSYLNGNMEAIRISNYARYRSNFIAPTEPLINDSGTQLLIHPTGQHNSTTIYDDNGHYRAPTSLDNVFGGEIDNTQKKFGVSSWYNDSEGDGLKFRIGKFLQPIGTGDYTFEGWVYHNTNSSSNQPHIYGMSGNTGTALIQIIYDQSSNQVKVYSEGSISQGSLIITGGSLSANTWTHIAVTRNSSDVKLFIDGTQSGSTVTGNTVNFANHNSNFMLGVSGDGDKTFMGYLDEMRVSKIARYTADFTPATEQFENDANTLMLMHFDGPDGSTNTIFDDNGVQLTPSNLYFRQDYQSDKVYLAVPFSNATQFADQSHLINSNSTQASATNGGNSNITTNDKYWGDPNYEESLENTATQNTASMSYVLSSSLGNVSSATYVVEGYFKAEDSTSNANWCLSSADSGGRWLFGINNGSTFSFGSENNIGIGTDWAHLAIVVDSGTKRFYHNGIYKGAWGGSNSGFNTLHVGQFNSGDQNDFRGHIQDLRVTIGSHRGYVGTDSSNANFVLPSSIVEEFDSTS